MTDNLLPFLVQYTYCAYIVLLFLQAHLHLLSAPLDPCCINSFANSLFHFKRDDDNEGVDIDCFIREQGRGM